jgi:hypothetical protein
MLRFRALEADAVREWTPTLDSSWVDGFTILVGTGGGRSSSESLSLSVNSGTGSAFPFNSGEPGRLKYTSELEADSDVGWPCR